MSSQKRPLDDEPEVAKSAKMRCIRTRPVLDEKTVKKIMAAIYFDINYVCTFRDIVHTTPEQGDVNRYRSECDKAGEFIGRAAGLLLNQENAFPHPANDRIKRLLAQVGWMIFAMCAYSEAFRLACMESEEKVWDLLLDYIWKNCCSMEVFARSRNLDWRGPLLTLTTSYYNLPGLQTILDPAPRLSDEHPHHYVQTSSDELRYPTSAGYVQTHTNHCMFDSKHWPEGSINPMLRRANDRSCELCEARDCSNCSTLSSLARNLIELVEYPNRGIGIRALANFKKGDVLDEFVGEVRPNNYAGDDVYSLSVPRSSKVFTPVALISPKRYGNWTRFINHSCNASTEFRKRIVGHSGMMAIEAVRNISFGDEITINYGDGYWNDEQCLCGEPGCISEPIQNLNELERS